MRRITITLTDDVLQALEETATLEFRTVPLQAEVALRRGLGLPAPGDKRN